MNLLPAQKAVVRAARAAGQLMRRNLHAVKKVNLASAHDIKLELDVRCQELIERQLYRAFPEIGFLGEEGTRAAADTEYRWVVDPIDGTVNFAYGLPHASVSIALQRRVSRRRSPGSKIGNVKYKTILGVVYDPFIGELWTALEDGPARLNGKIIHVSWRRSLAECMISIGFSKNRISLGHSLPYFAWLARRVRKVRMLGSAALGLVYVATGRLDAYIERSVNLWDIAAGGLIIERAGGKFWTEPTDAGKIRLIASNGLIHAKLPVPK